MSDWFSTENGTHIPINSNENKKEAYEKFFQEKRTKYFEKWNDAPEVELKESELDKYSDIKELRTAAKNYYQTKLQGHPVYKEGLGDIRISGKGLDEFMHYSSDPDKLKAVPQIPELIKKGKLGEFEEDYKGRTDYIKGFYPIYANLKTKNGIKKAELLIGKDNEGNLFYQLFLDFNREEAQKKAIERKKRNPADTQDRLSLINNISHFNLFLNPLNKDYYKMQHTTDRKEIDVNGYELRYDVPMTKIGVFPYLGKTISPELEPDRVYNVLRPKEELTKPETLKSL